MTSAAVGESYQGREVICVVGPTASGKSELAQLLAERLGGCIVSADSMQIYSGMDIGTGKVVPQEQRVPHYGLDLVEPGTAYSASLYQEYARGAFREIAQQGFRPILCGGTGFYVRAAIDDYQFPAGEQVENPVRLKYNEMAETEGFQAVWDELNRLDPESAAVVHPHNVKRVVRALEMHFEGESYARQLKKLSSIKQCVPAVFLGLDVPREQLYQRINTRVDGMVEHGLIEEVKRLLNNGFREGITAPQAIGYKEIVSALDGVISMDEAIEQIKQSSRRYAKRQISWFKADSRITWLDASNEGLDSLEGAALCQLAACDITRY